MTRRYRAAYAVTVALYGVVMIVANARNDVLSSTYTREALDDRTDRGRDRAAR